MNTLGSIKPPTLTPLSTPRATLTPTHLRLKPPHLQTRTRTRTRFKIHSMDAAQPYDYESKLSTKFSESSKLKIAIIGFGNYGQFLAKAFINQGHIVFAHSRTDYSSIANSIGATFFTDANDLCESHPNVILICTSILSTKEVFLHLPVERLRRNTLFVDVLSVKLFAEELFLNYLPKDFDILCTHPMFGPESGRDGWGGLPFVYDKVRIGVGEERERRVESFLEIFEKEGCRMVEMSCGEHDKYAGSQFITHTVGRVLEKLGLESTPINTKGYETVLDLVRNTSSDSFELYKGLFMYNDKAMEELQRLGAAFEDLKMQLFEELHERNRNQLFGTPARGRSADFGLKRSRAVLKSLNGNSGSLPPPPVSQASSKSAGSSTLTPAPLSPLPQKPHLQPYDYESKISTRFSQSSTLKIAIIGFGNYGQFLAKAFINQGHAVFAHSRTDYSSKANSIGATFFRDANDLCESHPDVILICTSILSTKEVFQHLPIERLRRSTLFVDVLSVKEFPKDLFLNYLPKDFDILCMHPMFGPESGRDGWCGLPFVYDKVRIGVGEERERRVELFLEIFEKEGCRMVEMSCGEHDKYAAGSQFITHTMGRVLEKLGLESTPINTKGYETVLDLVTNTSSDSFELYKGLFMYNDKAMEELQRLGAAFEDLKMQLFEELHERNRNQLFGTPTRGRSGDFGLKRSGRY